VGCLLAVLLLLVEVVPPVRRLRTRTIRAPAAPLGSQADICASWGLVTNYQQITVRISFRDRGIFGTEVTISWEGGGLGQARVVRSAVRELRRSIEIQSGSLTPYRPPE
jgi:hypothetical protein